MQLVKYAISAIITTGTVLGFAQGAVVALEPSADTSVGFFTGGTPVRRQVAANPNANADLEAHGDFDSEVRQGRILERYDLSSIPTGSTITSATLTIRAGRYWNLTGSSSAATVELRHIVPGNPWTQGGATWTTYNGTNAWTQTGVGGIDGPSGLLVGTGNFVSTTVYDTFTTPAPAGNNQPIGAPIELDITALVQQWVDGTLANNGLSLQLASGFLATGYLISVPNSDHANTVANTTPLLTITYVPEPASLGLMGLSALALGRRRRA